jgi:hypothetical protein
MDWLSDILGAVGSAASGGVFGAVGAFGSSIVKYFQRKQEQKFEKDEWTHEKDMFKLQMEATSQKGSWDGLIQSYKAEAKQIDSYRWVNACKSLYRPLLTTGLVIVTYMMFIDILKGLSGQDVALAKIFTGNELKEILRYIVYSLVFSTATAVAWWFCERALSPPGMKNR